MILYILVHAASASGLNTACQICK